MLPEAVSVAIDELPMGLHEPVSLWFERFADEHPEGATGFVGAARSRPALWRLVAASEFAAKTLLREWSWFRDEALPATGSDEVVITLADDASDEDAKRELRRVRNRRLLRRVPSPGVEP